MPTPSPRMPRSTGKGKGLLQMAQGISTCLGMDVFPSLAAFLGKSLGADLALASQVLEGLPRRARTLAVWTPGGPGEGFEYDLDGTPCGEVANGRVCVFRNDLQARFPANPFLAEQHFVAYAGAPLFTRDGEFQGLLCALFRRPLKDGELAESLLKICVERAEAELERMQAEEALRRSEATFRGAFDHAALGMALVDRQGRYLRANKALCSMLGYEAEEMTERTFAALTHPDDLADGLRIFQDMLDGRIDHAHLTKRYIRKDGRTLWADLTVSSVRAPDGRFLYYTSQVQDVTGQVEAAEAMSRAQTEAESGVRAKTEFLANMSHELRTPLNGVMGMIQLARLTELTPEQREFMDAALESSRRLLTIINDILDLSRAESGQSLLCLGEFSPEAVGAEVVRIFRPHAAAKDLRLEFRTNPDLPRAVIGDESRLRQILFNLVGNAVKFTEKGEVRLSAWTVPRPAEPDRPKLIFSVTDTGPGIQESLLANLFTPFNQGEHFLTKRYGGTGLGLAIARRLSHLMSGGICVDSEPGQGTTMHLSLTVGNPQPQPRSVPHPAEPEPHRQALRILLAEDDRTNQLVTKRLLEHQGHTVVVAENGRMTLDLLHRGGFDLVFLDIQMPVMDGLETARAIRAAKAPYRTIPIVALTAYAMPQDRDRCLAAGMDDHLAKPVTQEALARIIRRLAAGAGREGAATMPGL